MPINFHLPSFNPDTGVSLQRRGFLHWLGNCTLLAVCTRSAGDLPAASPFPPARRERSDPAPASTGSDEPAYFPDPGWS